MELSMTNVVAPECLQTLAANARNADERAEWPTPSWDALARAGVLRWAISPDLGGAGHSATSMLTGHEQLAGACLTTTFILSQREAALRRIDASANDSLRRELLEQMARG